LWNEPISLISLSWWMHLERQLNQQSFAGWWVACADLFWRSKCWDLPNPKPL
jgi:hypothetical protein